MQNPGWGWLVATIVSAIIVSMFADKYMKTRPEASENSVLRSFQSLWLSFCTGLDQIAEGVTNFILAAFCLSPLIFLGLFLLTLLRQGR